MSNLGIMFLVRKTIVALSAAVFLFMASACSDWPPYSEDLRVNYFENRQHFMRLSALVVDSGYSQVFFSNEESGLNVSLHNGKNKVVRFVEGAREKSINELLFKLGILNVQVYNGHIRLEMPERVVRGRIYTIYYLHSVSDKGSQICDTIKAVSEAGACKLPLDSNWRVIYRWRKR